MRDSGAAVTCKEPNLEANSDGRSRYRNHALALPKFPMIPTRYQIANPPNLLRFQLRMNGQAKHFCAHTLGRFQVAPAYPDTLLDISWRITAVAPNAKLGGDIVSLEGTVTDPDGTVVIAATFKALVVDHL